MTRQEQTGERDLTFSGWIRKNLPDSSTGFMVSDLDFILWNYKTRRMMLVEVKTHRAKMRFWQENLFNVLDELLVISTRLIKPPIDYRGFHCVRFEKTGFQDGRCMFDKQIVDESQLKAILSMDGFDEEVAWLISHIE